MVSSINRGPNNLSCIITANNQLLITTSKFVTTTVCILLSTTITEQQFYKIYFKKLFSPVVKSAERKGRIVLNKYDYNQVHITITAAH